MNTFFWIKRIYSCTSGPIEDLMHGGCARCWTERICSAFSTYEKAAEALAYNIKHSLKETYEDYYFTVGYQIIESVIDGQKEMTYDRDIHVWSFDCHGQLLADARCCSEYDDRPFRGRPANERPFEKGDFVISFCLGGLQVGIITGTPWTPERIEEREAQIGHTLELDASDDCYRVDFDDDEEHTHPLVTDVFPLPFPIEKFTERDKLLAVVNNTATPATEENNQTKEPCFVATELRICSKDLKENAEMVDVDRRIIGDCFASKEEASFALEKYLRCDRDLKAIETDDIVVVGYVIHKLNEKRKDEWPWLPEYCWSFDRNGNPLMDSPTNICGESLPFNGRTKETCSFEPCDKVLVYAPYNPTVTFGVVKNVPPSTKYAGTYEAMTGNPLTRESDVFTIAYPDESEYQAYPSHLFPMPE